MLRLTNVEVRYAGAILASARVCRSNVPEGHIVALLGANGAGKSTTLKAISGLLKSDGGQVAAGRIEFDGHPSRVSTQPTSCVWASFTVMEGRRVFQHLSVEDNLRAGAHTRGHARHSPRTWSRCTATSHVCGSAGRGAAGYLSGGEQQMLAIGRALMARPRLILLDEPSLGLAPLVVREIFGIIQRINRESGTSVLLVEQNARVALRVANYAYVLENGRVVLEGTADTLRDNRDVQDSYLGRRRRSGGRHERWLLSRRRAASIRRRCRAVGRLAGGAAQARSPRLSARTVLARRAC